MMTPNEKGRPGDGRYKFLGHGDIEYTSQSQGLGCFSSKGELIPRDRFVGRGNKRKQTGREQGRLRQAFAIVVVANFSW